MRLRHSLALLAAVLACENDLTVVDIPVSVRITPAADTLFLGESAALFSVIAVNLDGDTIPVTPGWRSLNSAVATIDSTSGLVTGTAVGEASIVARAGSLADTAVVTVLGALTLSLRLDTVLLAPGDTFSIPVSAIIPAGTGAAVTFSGGDSAVATVTPAGLVTAVAPGRATFTAAADTLTVGGVIDVLAVDDTLGGEAYVVIRGALTRHVRFPSRWFQYATGTGGSVVNLAARSAADDERILAVVRDSLIGPGLRTIGAFPTATATTIVCDPPNGWMLYQDRRSGVLEAQSVGGGGDLTIQRVEAIPGGRRVSATVDVTLRLTDTDLVTVYGRFVVPLLSLASCPG